MIKLASIIDQLDDRIMTIVILRIIYFRNREKLNVSFVWSDISLNIFDNEIAFISRYCEKRLFQKHVIIDHLGFISLINRFHQAITRD